MENFDNMLLCPISYQYFLEPYITCDGFTFEKTEIEKILDTTMINPMTQQKFENKNLTENKIMKLMVEEYLRINPDKKNQQYKKDILQMLFNMATNKIYDNNISEIDIDYIGNHNISNNCIREIFSDDDVVKIIIEKGKTMKKFTSYHIIHMLSRYSSVENIKKCVDKFGKEILEYRYREDWLPCHIMCYYGNYDNVIKYIKNIENNNKSEIQLFNGMQMSLNCKELLLLNKNLEMAERQKILQLQKI